MGGKEFILHESRTDKYVGANMSKYKALIKEYKKGNDIIPAINAKEMAVLAGIDYEIFRKMLNGEKPTKKRDFIILVGIILWLDPGSIDELLRLYGEMPVLNEDGDERDAALVSIAGKESRKSLPDAELRNDGEKRVSAKRINQILISGGFPPLDLWDKRKKQKKRTVDTKFKVIERYERTLATPEFADYYDSLTTQYGFHRYRCVAYMVLQEKDSGDYYELAAEPSESLCLIDKKSYPLPRTFNSIEETGEFYEYFATLQNKAMQETQKIDNLLNDTRNYRERISARIVNGKIHIFFETYNYFIPERNEYYLMEYYDGNYTLSVYHRSVFMHLYSTEDEYNLHYGKFEEQSEARYDSDSTFETLMIENKQSYSTIRLLQYRQSAFRRYSKIVEDMLQKLRKHEVVVKNIENFENIDEVCRYYKVAENYECAEDTETGILFAQKDSAEFAFNGGDTICITKQDLVRAFELGFPSIESIYTKLQTDGNIESALR